MRITLGFLVTLLALLVGVAFLWPFEAKPNYIEWG